MTCKAIVMHVTDGKSFFRTVPMRSTFSHTKCMFPMEYRSSHRVCSSNCFNTESKRREARVQDRVVYMADKPSSGDHRFPDLAAPEGCMLPTCVNFCLLWTKKWVCTSWMWLTRPSTISRVMSCRITARSNFRLLQAEQ
jgi:hypothetical protein